jgi:hypothetical protein
MRGEGERRKEKGERRQEKGDRRKEEGEVTGSAGGTTSVRPTIGGLVFLEGAPTSVFYVNCACLGKVGTTHVGQQHFQLAL